ncbi:MAG TPA: hypothetical protein VKN36_18380 [Eudoraea sp.]|nr:hypothetical protein [Eudoraea sp.]
MSHLKHLFCFVVASLAVVFAAGTLYGQNSKHKARVSLAYMKIMPETSVLTVTAKYRGEEGFEPASGLDFEVFNVLQNDSLVALGNTKTNNEGTARFDLKRLRRANADSTGTYHYLVTSQEHPDFELVEKDISFKDATLTIRLTSDQEVHFLSAVLVDSFSGEVLEGLPLRVQVQRLFRPMRIGDEFIITDEDGSINVPIDPGIPGPNGNLTLEVILSDDEMYGSVKALTDAPSGTPITDRSGFDERSMWGSQSKTPLFLLTIPNLLILGVWGTILLLVLNLIKIYKSKI